MDTFEEYLAKKKIDHEAFRRDEEGLWQEWETLFQTMHPNSFTAQKLFLINKIRRRFPQEVTKS
ncbi:hypothetical protein [Tunicatimonas pelagia]|uniref:hypothetical protein n=1 Tax=Tunicatimonas pelagia TaxID=931531 RepID=UPI002664E52E|nr:hypothetical protein [Tunicatimonas pelagia]WKN41734.1 hypothetical protein P0M28_22100 [Tunicatimonas pelagia]